MKNKSILAVTLLATLFSCHNPKTEITESISIDSTIEVNEVIKTEEESTPVTFMGTEKDSFKLYGHTDFDKSQVISLETMFEEFSTHKEFNGSVNVTINEVCQNAGCWINFQKPNSDETVMVFFRDHYTIPIEASLGKEAILYGQLKSDTLSVDFQKHLLDDAAANGTEIDQSEYDAIIEDKIDVSFDCESILVKN